MNLRLLDLNARRPVPRGYAKALSKPRDLNSLAKALVDQSTDPDKGTDPYEGKNPAAVELGRLGGRKGDKPERKPDQQRSAIAKKAAEARWKREE